MSKTRGPYVSCFDNGDILETLEYTNVILKDTFLRNLKCSPIINTMDLNHFYLKDQIHISKYAVQ